MILAPRLRFFTGLAAGLCLLATADAAEPAAKSPTKTPPVSHAPNAPSSPTGHSHTNRLAREKSPYLLQHQHNPVDWYAWGEEAFKKAKAEDKIIFLSIGYSTCHWCHVMERETFEDPKIGAFLKEHFVSIKVDREERPDVDKIYMTAVQAMSGSGGWPLNIFLTPDLKPIYGGTYFPPDNRYGRPSFTEITARISDLWKTRKADLVGTATQIHQQLTSLNEPSASKSLALGAAVLAKAADKIKAEYDPRHGGFGKRPKFPRPSQPAFLLAHAARHADADATRMVLHTCERMAAGGMYDQLGGGFARYSVDAEWLVPHFEKMLYDNAQLVQLYLDAHLVSGDAQHAAVARDILRYVARDMTHPRGGFYSAEDADSEGKEGKFYCWTRAELEKLLTAAEFKIVVRHFGITEKGNFVDHSDPKPLPGQNVLSLVDPKLTADETALLARAKKKMFETRAKRVRPHLDDKILASWNGLMLGAFARAYAVLGDETFLTAAEKNLAFLQSALWDSRTKTLFHRWRDGERDTVQLLDAYAYLLSGVLELYEATLAPQHLEFALALADTMIAKFHDPAEGAFFTSPAGSADLILRTKESYDGAEPSGNSVAALALLKLAALTDRADLRQLATKTIRVFGERLQATPQAVPYLLQALAFSLEEPRRIVIAGDPKTAGARALVRAAHSRYQPLKVVLGNTGPVEPFARTLTATNGPTAYVCTGTACQAPTQDPAKLKALLR